mgnify:CR=1 FL=1
MDDRERGLAFLFAITLPPIMVWFLVAKFTYGIDVSTAKYLMPYLVKNTFSLWPLWSALIAGWFGNDSNLLIVFYVQIMPDDFVMQLHRF